MAQQRMVREAVRQGVDLGPGRGVPAHPGRGGQDWCQTLGARRSEAFQRKLGSLLQEEAKGLPQLLARR